MSEAIGEAPDETADRGDRMVERSSFENQDRMVPSASVGEMGDLMKSLVRSGLLFAWTTVYECMFLFLRMMSLVVAASGSLKTGVMMVGILVRTFLRVRISLRVWLRLA